VRASEARPLVQDGDEPVLKKSRGCLLKKPENLTDNPRVKTLGELRFGAEKSQQWECVLANIKTLRTAIPLANLLEVAGEHYGQIIGNNDLWLTAHARAEGWVLVTNNEHEFIRVPDLLVENWGNP